MVRISNLKILNMLKENARIPYTEIARRLRVSETAVRKRIKQLEKEKIIKKYTIEIDLKKIGYELITLIGVDTKPEDYIKIIEQLKKRKDVVTVYPSTGDHMIILECWFKDMHELEKFVKTLEKKEGVTRVCPAIILEKI